MGRIEINEVYGMEEIMPVINIVGMGIDWV